MKVYGTPSNERTSQARYSPGQVIDTYTVVLIGQSDMDLVCTSHAERHNLTLRMQIRRLTRLTNAHSKKWANHRAALALFFAFYNFCRVHTTLCEEAKLAGSAVRKVTPAMAAGLTDHVWSVEELLRNAA